MKDQIQPTVSMSEELDRLWQRVMEILESDRAEEFLDLLEQRLAEKVAEKERQL